MGMKKGGLAAKAAAGLAAVLALGLVGAASTKVGPAAVDALRMRNADNDPGQWMSWGRGYDEQRFSPLTQINDKNVGQLGLAWYADYDTYRGNEATPVVVDGVIYNTTPWNVTYAYDGKTGKQLWVYDPKVPPAKGRQACCDIVTRGLAVWKGKVIIGALDGRVIAIDAKTGKEVWATDTFKGEPDGPLTLTGAVRVFDGTVMAGTAGADFGVRGFVTALDAETGKIKWKFYTVPGAPGKKDGQPSDAILETVRSTWTGDNYYRTDNRNGGGGSVWDSITYDPQLKQIYIGVGNGSPWSQKQRSPQGGDNLFLSSIVALNSETGEYVWHYQETPGDEWDYTATQQMILADLKIDGQMRKVIMQAPKNGYFYVIDRTNGRFISAKPFATQTWTKGMDPNGRPIIDESKRYGEDPMLVWPAGWGAHNWNPMSFSPKTGLVYIPVTDQPQTFSYNPPRAPGTPDPYAEKKKRLGEEASLNMKSWLSAWDPIAQKERWRVMHEMTGNGGTLSTAGNLVFQGTTNSKFNAYTADTGQKVWEFDAQTVPIAGGVSYSVDGEQYIAINVGWGGGLAHIDNNYNKQLHISKARLLVFKLNGKAQLPPLPAAEPLVRPPFARPSEADYNEAARLFEEHCAICHGHAAAGGIKDLRRMSPETRAQFDAIVRGGIREDQGMASFADVINEKQAQILLQYINARANEDWGKY